jgi:hypothetical protein
MDAAIDDMEITLVELMPCARPSGIAAIHDKNPYNRIGEVKTDRERV